MQMPGKVMIASLLAVSVGFTWGGKAIATTPQDPNGYIYRVEPANLPKVREEVGQQVAKLVEELKNKPTQISPDTFVRRMDQLATLVVLVQAWARGEMRVTTITGHIDTDWETKAWKPLSEAAVTCAEVCDWLKANGDEALKKADPNNVRQMSDLKSVQGMGLLKRRAVETVALVAKFAKRHDCVEEFFKKLGGTIDRYDPKVDKELPGFTSAKAFIDYPHNIKDWVWLPETATTTTPAKVAAVKESDQKLAKAAILEFFEAANRKTPEVFDKLLSDPAEIALAKASLEKVDAKVDTSKAVFTFVPDPAGNSFTANVDELTLVNAKNETRTGRKTFIVHIEKDTVKLRIGGRR